MQRAMSEEVSSEARFSVSWVGRLYMEAGDVPGLLLTGETGLELGGGERRAVVFGACIEPITRVNLRVGRKRVLMVGGVRCFGGQGILNMSSKWCV